MEYYYHRVFDSLFDRYLISFKDNGELLISKKLNQKNVIKLGLRKDIKINVSERND